MKKRIISAVAAVCLVLSSAAALPQGVFDTTPTITASAVSTATSGTCGENLTWTLSDGVLTISGTGAMTNYKNNESPFCDRTDIQSVVIKSGVTSIGYHAFNSCKNLVSISIKSTVVRIGMAAFSGCKALMDISIPSSVKYIDDSAFIGCTTLTSVDIPASVESIGEHAFYGCTNLASITIPNGLTNIGGWAFLETKWLENERKKNPLVVVNGMLIDARTYKGELTVPSNVERIGNAAFGGNNDLTAVTIPNSVTNIGEYAFEDCDNLISATLPNGITFIPSGLFRLCDNLKTVNIPDSVDMIDSQAFYGCKSLESITLPDGVEAIDTGAFYCCYKLEDINIPSSVKFIETWAFENCPNLTSLTIPSSVESIGNDAIDKKCTIICEKGSKAEKYAKDNGLDYNYSDGDYIYKELADGNVEITGYTGKASALSIPSTLGGKKVTKIGKEAFFGFSSLKRVTVPKSVTSIGEKALGYYDDNGTTKKVDQFMICCERYSVADTYAWDNGFDRGFIEGDYIYKFLGTSEAMIVGYTGSEANITVPSQLGGMTVAGIHASSFKNCTSLKSVTVPDCVEGIGDSAFSSCTNLKSITLPNQLDSISRWLFDGCTSLEKITIPSSAKGICRGAFNGCTSLTSITIPSGVKYLDQEAFKDCTSLKSVTIPGSVTNIDYNVFKNCTSLTSVTFKNGVTAIGYYMFEGCSNLSSVSIPDSVTTIEPYAFFDCTSLNSITLTKNVTSIADRSLGYYIDTKTGRTKKVDGFTIYGYKNTSAEKYAKDNGFTFVALPTTSRLAGDNRYATAAEIAKKAYPSGAKTVILASGMTYADALVGVPLASKLNAPILLAAKDSLPRETTNALEKLGAKKVIILGGKGAVGDPVEITLNKQGITTERYAGTSRFGTATAIAEKLNENPTDVFFVYYNGFPDALSASTAAALKNAPIIYLTTDGDINADTAAYIAKLKKAGSVKNAYVIGGNGVITDNMLKKVGTALGVTPKRLYGDNRYDTCVAVNNEFKSVLSGNSICLATGADYPDALAGGVFAAIQKAPLFLINGKVKALNLSDKQKAYLKTQVPNKIYTFGGIGVVPNPHVTVVENACG